MKHLRRYQNLLAAVFTAGIVFLLSLTSILYTADKLFVDPLYQTPSTPDNRIRILAVDEKTLAAYGSWQDWDRSISARLVDLLWENLDTAPAVLAFDVMYISERDAASDAAFAEACQRAGSVVTAANLVYRTQVSSADGKLIVDPDHVEMAELPYPTLAEASLVGFANNYLDRDQFVRFARLSADYDGQTVDSLPFAVWKAAAEADPSFGPVTPPKTDARGLFSFAYTARSGEYEVLSLCDILEGRIDPAVLKGCIVLVGAYAPGMQDSYNAPIQRGNQMYGVEIQANILEALMEGRTALPVNNLLYSLIAALLAAALFLVLRRLGVVPGAILSVGFIALVLAAGKLLFMNGLVIRVIEPVAAAALIYVGHLGAGYLQEALKKRRILNAFKKYVAPQVVDEVSKQGDFSITLGGEKRPIAVLFVDIRGFTPMSEGLQPEEVVGILNEYLALTTDAIFKNNGTLDKFIGDAAMAVFNAPFDLDDYVYRAVCTARDISAGSADLQARLMERFGKSISFGIGVNCGDAVVGNIGCDFRMDYTAIGDTVNTAARLESNAKPGQILISHAVYEALIDRVKVTPVGAIPLKGKSNEVFVYQVDEVL